MRFVSAIDFIRGGAAPAGGGLSVLGQRPDGESNFNRRNVIMQLSSPKMITWVIALIIGVIGILANLVALPVVTAAFGFWLLVIAFLLLLVGSAVKGI